MFRTCWYDTRSSTMHLWETFKGEPMYSEIPWVPYIFIPNDKGSIKTPHGQSVSKKDFKDYIDYYSYAKNKSDIFEDRVKPEIQFLAERYHAISDDNLEVPKLKIYSIDIEINYKDKFPNASEALEPVCLISIHNMLDEKTIVFGEKPYTGEWKNEKWLTYLECPDEEILLKRFFNYMYKYPPDVITGWSVSNFDIVYLINRAKRIFGEHTNIWKRFSPIEVVSIWDKKDWDGSHVDIAGVTILDYMDLYKRNAKEKLERYSLEYVSMHELEKGKIDYSKYEDLRELYAKDWNLYVKYNIVDSLRVGQLENKLGYIKLVQGLSLLTKVPMRFYQAVTSLIEGSMLTYFRRNGMCAPKFKGGIQEAFVAAFVKEPYPGMFDWTIDLDIASSYPTAIITLNMSTETYYGRILDLPEDDVAYYTKHKNFPDIVIMKDDRKIKFTGDKLRAFNETIEKKVISIAPCGSIFDNRKLGVIAAVEKELFVKRAEIKGRMLRIKESLSALRGDDLTKANNKRGQLDSMQDAIKLILNSMYGGIATPYSRYFNKNIAEAVVSCGRYTIRQGEKFVNDLMNNPSADLMIVLEEMRKN
jgi:DNA polymerase elongation subunit (family B)